MIDIAKINENDRKALFQNTAAKMGLTDAIIEKDFWVCFMLDYLFHRCKWKDKIAFKGGTSLSKSYGLIERFSEDIDLILDWRVLGYSIDEPWQERSNTKQDIFNKEANSRTEEFLREVFMPGIVADLEKELPSPIKCYIEESDPQTVVFAYSRSFDDFSILPVIRLEIGALAAWTPAAVKPITPYAATQYPRLFKQPTTDILTVLPERTFWEKVTILHREANRPEDKTFPARYSRHYYDLYCMANSPVKDAAFKNIELLEKVVLFKEKLYRCPWAKYEDAKIGTMKLMPSERNLQVLKDDYEHMQNMIFGKKIPFDTILEGIENLGKEMNSL
ncbi:nucleotidyl transferase AbiEii/AbiGii toxin family protein [Congzhengia sp.]|uniref:nucleotidyl transferase AbiEii/AbiGii toxin family protein n=1 Tax=Congzhengia sp. TaxID=2944168 RepID=UPI003077DB73